MGNVGTNFKQRSFKEISFVFISVHLESSYFTQKLCKFCFTKASMRLLVLTLCKNRVKDDLMAAYYTFFTVIFGKRLN